MITREQVMPMLINACPSFSEKWQEVSTYYEHEDLVYVYLGEFAHHLIHLLNGNQTEEFPAIFDVIERLHIEGDAATKEIATIGALEAIQNVAENSGVDPEIFFPFLGPESGKCWVQLNDFWQGLTSFVGDPPKTT